MNNKKNTKANYKIRKNSKRIGRFCIKRIKEYKLKYGIEEFERQDWIIIKIKSESLVEWINPLKLY